MNKAEEYCRLTVDIGDSAVSKWITEGLGLPVDEAEALCCIGFILGDELIGGVMFEGNPSKSNLWLSIYTVDKRWCSRRTLRYVFGLAFNFLKVSRLNILVDEDNYVSRKFVEKLGFINEGMLRSYRKGKNVYIFGMLKNECKFI